MAQLIFTPLYRLNHGYELLEYEEALQNMSLAPWNLKLHRIAPIIS